MTLTIPKPRPYNWREHTKPEDKSCLKNSRTVPDMNYSIREILNKFTTGQPINGMVAYNDFDGEYQNNKSDQPDFEGFMPHPKTLDLVDRQRMAKQAKEQLRDIDTKTKDRETKLLATKNKEQQTKQSLSTSNATRCKHPSN